MARRMLLLMVLAAFGLGSCSGSGAGPTQNTSGTPTASGGGGPTARPAQPTPNGSASAAAACALLTLDEAAGALGTSPLTATESGADPSSSSYSIGPGDEALRLDILRNGAETQYQGFVDAGSSESVDGVGDKALFERGTRRLLFIAGGALVYVFPRYVGSADRALAASTAIGKIIAARLTTGTVPPALVKTPPPVVSAKTACDLLSAEEAAAVLGNGPMRVDANANALQFCTYAVASTGEVVLSTYLQRTGGGDAFAGFESSLTTDPVSGIGAKAIFEASTGILFVLQGDAVFNVNVFGVAPAAARSQDEALARVMLTHL